MAGSAEAAQRRNARASRPNQATDVPTTAAAMGELRGAGGPQRI
jgi:hypothetical protein